MTGTVVPYIGTWIEGAHFLRLRGSQNVVPYIGTWIEGKARIMKARKRERRTLYRYVD